MSLPCFFLKSGQLHLQRIDGEVNALFKVIACLFSEKCGTWSSNRDFCFFIFGLLCSAFITN